MQQSLCNSECVCCELSLSPLYFLFFSLYISPKSCYILLRFLLHSFSPVVDCQFPNQLFGFLGEYLFDVDWLQLIWRKIQWNISQSRNACKIPPQRNTPMHVWEFAKWRIFLQRPVSVLTIHEHETSCDQGMCKSMDYAAWQVMGSLKICMYI